MDTTKALFFSLLLLLLPSALLHGESTLESDLFVSSIPGNTVQDFIQGSGGEIWIGTRKGLFRYNGSTYLRFIPRGDSSLSSEFILSLLEDEDGSLWVGTDSGLNHIQDGKVILSPPPMKQYVFRIGSFSADKLVFSGAEGIYLFDKSSGTSTLAFADPAYTNTTQMICADGTIWARSSDMHAIAVLDKNLTRTATLDFGERYITDITPFEGTIHVLTSSGIEIFSPAGQRLPLPATLQPLKGKRVVTAMPDKISDKLFYGVSGEGFYSFSSGTGLEKENFTKDQLTSTLFAKGIINKDIVLLQENYSTLSIYPRNKVRNLVTYNDFLPGETLLGLHTRADAESILAVTNKRVLALGLDGILNKVLKTPGLSELGQVTHSFMDSRGRLILCGDRNLLLRYSPIQADDPLSDFRCDLSLPLQGSFVSPWENPDSEVCFLEGLVLTLLHEDGSVEKIPLGEEIKGHAVTGEDGNLYYLGENGIFTMDAPASFRRFPLEVRYPSCGFIDKDGVMWIGTARDGLVVYNPSDGSVRTIGRQDGLPANNVRAILQENEDNIWVSTPNDIARISKAGLNITRLPGSGEVLIFEPRCAALLKRKWGGHLLYFGGDKNLAVINPFMQGNSPVLDITLDALIVNNELKDIGNGIPLRLSHEENQLVFYYSGMYYSPEGSLNYAYRLEGFDKDWIVAGQRTNASYTNLPAGNYTFRAKAQGADGVWCPKEASLSLKIQPSPWRSPLAWILYSLLFFVITGFLIRQLLEVRRSRARAHQAELEKKLTDRLFQDKVNFLSNISHEIRTPLSLIYGPAVELEKEENLSPKSKRLVSLINGNVQRLQSLSKQVLDFSHTASDEECLHVKQTHLRELLSLVMENYSFMLSEKELTLSDNIPASMQAWCDPEIILKIFTNLLSNAVKYTQKGGAIEVECLSLANSHARELYLLDDSDYKGPYAEISVKDNGIGIPQHQIDRIFTRYERLRPSLENGERPEGFGVGLNYALFLSELHKGKIRVRPNTSSVSGKGSIFSFVFPLSEDGYVPEERIPVWQDIRKPENGEPAGSHADQEADDFPEELSGKRVLIVEDQPEVRSFIVMLLSGLYTTMEASNGEEAWERINECTPDLIVSDVMMPYKDGVALCTEIKESTEFCHIPVILLTAKAEMESRISGLSAGADAYIPKPFNPDLLKVSIRTILQNRLRFQRSLLEGTSPDESTSDQTLSGKDRHFLDNLYEIAERNLDNEEYSIASFAREMYMSQTGFYLKVKGLLGVTPQNWFISYRLNKAMELLKTHELNISEVCYRVGFSSRSSFARSFKNKFGVSPSSI